MVTGSNHPVSTPPLTGSGRDRLGVDPARLMAEIYEEADRRRASGEVPAELERDLELLFQRFAPAATREGDFQEELSRTEQLAFVDYLVPTESTKPGVAFFKKLVRKLVGWYMRYVVQQVSSFGHAVTRTLGQLGERVETLEHAAPVTDERVVDQLRVAAAPPDLSPWHAALVDGLRALPGRVCHAEAGRGALVATLTDAGVDAYGVEPLEPLAIEGSGRGLDIRSDKATAHLAALPDGSLGGLVLTGCVERLPLSTLVHLADLAGAKVAIGGRVAIVSATPAAWLHAHSPAEVDLAPGRPLHAETWDALLAARGFREIDVQAGRSSVALAPVPGEDDAARVLNANLARLNETLFGPDDYLVTATRSS